MKHLLRRLSVIAALIAIATLPAHAQPIVPLIDGAEAVAALSATSGGNAARRCTDWPNDGRGTIATVIAARAGSPWVAGIPVAAWPALADLTDSVAARLRDRLGARPGFIASPPDSTFNWRQLGSHLHVVAYRTGSMRWWIAGETPFHAPMNDSAAVIGERMLASALDTVVRGGGGLRWPAAVTEDSIAFLLRFAWPLPTRDTAKYELIEAPHAAPVAAILVPVITAVEQRRAPRVGYPYSAQRGGASGMIRLQFTVDTTGRVDPESIKDVWDTPAPKPQGALGSYYKDFVNAARQGVLKARYAPATIGSCPVPMPVVQEFSFSLTR